VIPFCLIQSTTKLHDGRLLCHIIVFWEGETEDSSPGIGNASESSWRGFVDGAIYPMTSPALTPWLMRPIESCSDLSPNVGLMSYVTFSKRSQPPYVPLELGRITLSCLSKRTRILFRGHYTMLSAPPRRIKLSVKTAGRNIGKKQYFSNN